MNYRKYFEARLPGVKLGGRGNVKCPLHDDRTASLSVKLDDGIWFCHAGCGNGGVIDFEMKFSKCDRDTAKANVAGITGDSFKAPRKVVATYQYQDAAGRLLFEKVRYEPKEFSQRVPDGKGGYSYRLDGIQKPLYRLPKVLTSNQIAICEGEKDADRVQQAFEKHPHFAATTNFDGAGKWRDEYAPYFAGKQVVILPDNDKVGIDHAETVAKSVSQYAASVKVVRLPDLPEKGDVSDYLDKHTAEQLSEQIKSTPRWMPKAPGAQKLFVNAPDFVAAVPTEIEWLVDGVIQRGANGFFVAQPKGGKSWAAIDLAISLSRGIPWLEFAIPRPVRTALISREDNPALTAWRLKHLSLGKRGLNQDGILNLYINSRQQSPELMLDNTEQLSELMGAMEQFRPEFAIFDVFNVMHAADENDNSEMRAVLRQLTLLQSKIGCGIGVIHHFNKADDRSITQRIRGASAIAGWAEWVIAISMADEREKIRKMEFELKAAEAPEPVFYKINSTQYDSRLERCQQPDQPAPRKRTTDVLRMDVQ